MRLSRSNNKVVADSFKEVTDLGTYIRFILEIYQSSEMPKDLRLTGKEKDFYVATVVHVLNGFTNPIVEESLQIYRKYFDSVSVEKELKRKVADYMGRLRRKKWLRYDKWEKFVELPVPFKLIENVDGQFEFNLKFRYEKANALEL